MFTTPESARLNTLPELDGEQLKFTWDLEFDETTDEPHIVLMLDGERLLHEKTWCENSDHFRSVIVTLIKKYPGRVYDVVPTDYAKHFLFGDDMGALEEVPRIRDLCGADYFAHLNGTDQDE
jgi:hypothetical protein